MAEKYDDLKFSTWDVAPTNMAVDPMCCKCFVDLKSCHRSTSFLGVISMRLVCRFCISTFGVVYFKFVECVYSD